MIKYSISTGQIVDSVELDLNDYYNGRERVSVEAEGLSVNDGNLYLGVVSRECTNSDCSSTRSYNDIMLITGI